VRNGNNIRSSFAACGIYPLDVERVLKRLPPEDNRRREVLNEFDRQLTDELRRKRYGEGEAPKRGRARKVNRLPPGMSYTVSANPDLPATENQAGTGTVTLPARYGTGKVLVPVH